MSNYPPIEHAALAMWEQQGDLNGEATYQDPARAAFRSIDPDRLARVIHRAWCKDYASCSYGFSDNAAARAVIEHLLNEEKSNE